MPREPKPWFWKKRAQWIVNINRVRHYLGPDRKEAFEKFYRLMQAGPQQPRVSAASIPAIVDAFLDWVEANRSEATYGWYRYRLERFCRHLHRERLEFHADQLKPHHVTAWVGTYPKLKKTTRRNYLRSVKRCFKWAAKQGFLESNPVEHLEIPAADHREVVISVGEYQRVLSSIPDEGLQDLIVTSWETGCRPQESLRVEARHVDLANQRWVFPPSEAKGERLPRIVYLTDEALQITRRLMLKRPSGTLFRNSRNRPWTSDAVNCAIDRIAVRMGKTEMQRLKKSVAQEDINAFIPTLKPKRKVRGREVTKTAAELRHEAKSKLTKRLAMSLVPRYSLYAFRHSWATHALERGVDSVTVAVLLGHSDPSMLAKVYQHLAHNPKFLLEQAKQAAARA